MTCFELYHNIKRFFYSVTGRNLCSLEDFYLITLQKRRVIQKAKALSHEESVALILHQDKEIFEAWKENKNLSIENNLLCFILIACFIIIIR